MDWRCSRVVLVMGEKLARQARWSNRKQHIEQGLAARAAYALDRKQPALGDRAAMRGDLVRIAARFEHAMAGNNDHEGIAGNRLCDGLHGTGSPEPCRDLAIGPRFAAGNRPRDLVNPLIEGMNAAHIERDV